MGNPHKGTKKVAQPADPYYVFYQFFYRTIKVKPRVARAFIASALSIIAFECLDAARKEFERRIKKGEWPPIGRCR